MDSPGNTTSQIATTENLRIVWIYGIFLFIHA